MKSILIVIFSFLTYICTPVYSFAQPAGTPPKGSGWWLTSAGEWEPRSCPSAALSLELDSVVQRLPMGCKALQPSIAYSVKTDIRVRQDLAAASVKIKGLDSELKLSRESLLAIQKRSAAELEKSSTTLQSCIDLNDLHQRSLTDTKKALFWAQVTVVMFVVGTLGLGFYAFSKND